MLRNIFKVSAAISVLQLFSVGAASAATVDIVRLANNPHNTEQGVRLYETGPLAGTINTGVEGDALGGSVITANYADGTSEEIIWEALRTFYPDPSGGYYSIDGEADGTDTYMYMSWDGFDLTADRLLSSLTIDLAPASVAFDTLLTYGDDPRSTDTTLYGFPFEIYAGGAALEGNITATYSGIVGLAGAAPTGDLFTTMTVDFSGLTTNGFLGDMSFRSDMDAMRVGDLTPVPLPASLPLLLAGVAGLGLSRRRRR